jgi:hypothetical protein
MMADFTAHATSLADTHYVLPDAPPENIIGMRPPV